MNTTNPDNINPDDINAPKGNEPDFARMIIAKDQARVAQMKWVTVALWLACILTCVSSALCRMYDWNGAPFAILCIILFYLAVASTIRLYLAARSADMRQIKATLSSIEQLLRQITRKD